MRAARPVILASLANALLFLAVDRSQPWMVASAAMGMLLLGAVLVRQLGEIVELEDRVLEGARRLSVVSEVISALNSSSNVGSTLTAAFGRLRTALSADAAAVWLPGPEGGEEMVVVEQHGLSPDQLSRLLNTIREASGPQAVGPVFHSARLGAGDEVPVQCLSVRMGGGGEEFGYLSLVKHGDGFTTVDADILAAVATDLGNALRSVRMLSEARKLADRDPVTGLLNHRSVHQRLQSEVERHRRSGGQFAVVMLDLNNFKLYNDTYGHPAGDEVLKKVGFLLRRTCRESDVVARYGGDEFMLLLPETTGDQARRCAQRIQAVLSRERFQAENSRPLPVEFCFGIAVYPEDGQDARTLVAAADRQLYHAKAGGAPRPAGRSSALEPSVLNRPGCELFLAMLAAVDNKDGYTRQHSEEVIEYALEIGRGLAMEEGQLASLRVAAILHDVGKIGVPDHVLRKPGTLTPEEMEQMRQHPAFGALLVGALSGMEDVVPAVRHHHERFDGRGYPDGLTGEAIPLTGRILAVADAFSAMTTTRPYRKALTERQALQEIERNLGGQFDPLIGALFIHLRQERARAARAERGARAAERAARRAEAEPASLAPDAVAEDGARPQETPVESAEQAPVARRRSPRTQRREPPLEVQHPLGPAAEHPAGAAA
jgi:diguanylate cyclase (GGDEF)-like protein